MLVGNTTSVPDYYKYFSAAPSKNQSAQHGFLQAWFGKLECLSSEGGGRKLFLHPASLVKKSFPFHSQPLLRPHWDNGLPHSPFFFRHRSKTQLESLLRNISLSFSSFCSIRFRMVMPTQGSFPMPPVPAEYLSSQVPGSSCLTSLAQPGI